MSAVDDGSFEGTDRFLFGVSSFLAEPFCWAYGLLRFRFVAPIDPNKFDNRESIIKEIANRTLIFTTAVATFVFAATPIAFAGAFIGATCKAFRILAIHMQKEGFTHVKGKAQEKFLEKDIANVMTWNIRGLPGGLHYSEAGVVQWQSRLDAIIHTIESEDPDVLVLQDVQDTALAEKIIERLQEKYAHFFYQLGANFWGKTDGSLILSKCAVHRFSHQDFANNARGEAFGFDILEIKAHPEDTTPAIRLVGSELIGGKEKQEIRKEQFSQIIDTLAKEKMALPTIFVGNTNVERDSEDEGAYFSQYLYHCYRGQTPTHTNELAAQWSTRMKELGNTIDIISLVKRNLPCGLALPVMERNLTLLDCHLVKAFDETYNTKTALSDHHGIVTKFEVKS